MTSLPKPGLIFGGAAALLVTGAIIAGLATVGGPQTARDLEADRDLRIRMSGVLSSFECYYRAYSEIPSNFETLNTGLRQEDLKADGMRCAGRRDSLKDLVLGEKDDIYLRDSEPNSIRVCGEFRRGLPAVGGTVNRYDRQYDEQTEPGEFCLRFDPDSDS